MKRLEPIAVIGGLAVVATVAALVPVAVGAGLVGAAGLALVLWAPPVCSLALPLVVVQVLGAGFRPPGLPLGAAQLCYLPLAAVVLLRRSSSLIRLTRPLDHGIGAIALVTLVATGVGVVSGAKTELIKEDVVPVVFLAATYVATRVLVRTRRDFDLVLAAVVVGSVLAAAKLTYLLVVPAGVGWEGPWQATRLVTFGIPRIILRGADVFFAASTLIVAARFAWAGRAPIWATLAGLLGLGGVIVSGTRSNWIGLAAGVAAIWLIGRRRSPLRLGRLAARVAACALALMIVVTVVPRARGFATRAFAAAGARAWTVTFRLVEARGVLEAGGASCWLGNGMGATYQYLDIAQGMVVEGAWSHNAYLQWLLKAGIVGLAVFLGVCLSALREATAMVRARHHWAPGLLGVAAGLATVMVLSVAANKVFEFSGAMFLGLALGTIQSAQQDEPTP